MVCGARRQQMVRTAGDCRSHGRGDGGIEAGISESGRQCAEGTREGAPRAVDGEAHQEVKVVRRCYATRGPRPSETSSLLTYSRLARLVSFPLITAREPLRVTSPLPIRATLERHVEGQTCRFVAMVARSLREPRRLGRLLPSFWTSFLSAPEGRL